MKSNVISIMISFSPVSFAHAQNRGIGNRQKVLTEKLEVSPFFLRKYEEKKLKKNNKK